MGRFLRLTGGKLVSFDEAATASVYDQIYTVVSLITSGTAISLPLGQTYVQDGTLKVFLNGVYIYPATDYTYVNTTQISFPYDLLAGDQVRFRIG